MSVVLDHSTPILGQSLVGGRTAVECFFIISGFYMALVMATKYGKLKQRRWRTFMAARVSRLLPVYLVVLVGAVAALGLKAATGQQDETIQAFASLAPVPLALVGLSNLTMIGQHVLLFTTVNPAGGLDWVSAVSADRPPVLIPQAWSLSLELLFYVLVPWIVRLRTPWIVGLAAGSLIIRLALAAGGLTTDPWSYRFFPSELLFFLAGVLAYRLLYARPGARLLPGPWALVVTVALLLGFQHIAPAGGWVLVAFPLFFAYLVPSLFTWTKNARADRWVGELSYPLYLVHVLAMSAVGILGLPETGWVLLPIALVASVALLVLVDLPSEKWRQARLRRELPPEAAAQATPLPVLPSDRTP